MTRVVWVRSVCHCEEDKSPTRQSIVSRRTRADSAVRLPLHSGSPRAFIPRDHQKWGKGTARAYFSLFTLTSLAFLETYTESYVVYAGAGGGKSLKRLAERRAVPTLPKEPPRMTRCEPEAGPVGSTTGLPVGQAAWYQSAVHSHTFPCMSKKPHELAENCPTSTVWLGSSPTLGSRSQGGQDKFLQEIYTPFLDFDKLRL